MEAQLEEGAAAFRRRLAHDAETQQLLAARRAELQKTIDKAGEQLKANLTMAEARELAEKVEMLKLTRTPTLTPTPTLTQPHLLGQGGELGRR